MRDVRLKGFAIPITAAVVALLCVLPLSSCREPAEKVRIGVFPDSVSALLYIAREKGMFRRHGLDVALQPYQAGAYAVDDLLAGRVDLATASEFVLARRVFQARDLRTIGSVSSTDCIEVIARADRGIGNPEQLRGKRIGVSKGTIAEFFLGTFLASQGIRPAEVSAVDLKPADIIAALAEGRLDAAVLASPQSDAAKESLAGNFISWPAQGGQEYYFLLITKDEWIETHLRAVSGLLEATLEASAFLKEHDSESQKIVSRALALDPKTIASTWSTTRFGVHLDQQLLILMEDEARWAVRHRLVDAEAIPNYLDSLHLDSLEKIRSDAVSVVH